MASTTYSLLKEDVARILREAGIAEPAVDARWLIEAATGRSEVESVAAEVVDTPHVERAHRLAQRRAGGEPLQYVTGIAGFRRLELAVGPGALIPRPETEVVAGHALELLPANGTLVDVGTGCGAIALAVAHERPDARVVATDISEDALAWARKNKDATGLDVKLIQCDLLAGLSPGLRGCVDVIVSNPPYVATGDTCLADEVVLHEPHVALFAGHDGVATMDRLARDAVAWLRPGGWLVIEIGDDQATAVEAMLADLGYREVAIAEDLAGRRRVALGRAPK